MSLSKNQNVELYIDSFTSEGSGVGRYENMAVFVSGAAAGDKVTAHIIKVKKDVCRRPRRKGAQAGKIAYNACLPVFSVMRRLRFSAHIVRKRKGA